MFRKLQLLYVFICSCFSVGFASDANIFVLGFPRSGNHWSCYTLARLMNMPCISHPASGPFIWVSDNVEISFDESQMKKDPLHVHAFYHGHNPINCAIDKADQSTDFLIVLLRDYKESLMSNNYDNETNAVLFLENDKVAYKKYNNPFMSRDNSYFNILRCYEAWDPQKRFLIYYEDFITKPKQVLTKLSHFLDFDEAIVEEYISDLEYHKEQALDTTYLNEKRREDSEDLRKHTKKMKKQNIKYMDDFVERNFPALWNRYLSRYKSNDE